jgi:hypothetical protein
VKQSPKRGVLVTDQRGERVAQAAEGGGSDHHGQAVYLSIRVLAVAVIAFVVITSFQARPAPGGQGEALGVAVGLIAFCGATIAAMWLTQAGSAAQLAVLVIAVVSAAALIGLQGNDAAFLGVFPAVCLAALVLPVRLSALIAGLATAAVWAAWLANGRAPIAGIVLNDFGILAFFLLSLFARRLRRRRPGRGI